MIKLHHFLRCSMFSNQPSIPHTQLQLFAAPTVVIVSGWGGAGKTQTIARALEGLAQNIDQVGVIINERSQGSVDIDLARLPKGFEKLGLHGCACCSQLSDVLDGIATFRSQGRALTFIEQSPLSITGELRSGLGQRGYGNVVLFLFNPAQFNDAPGIHVQGIRDADIVVVTHQSSRSSLADKALRIVDAARGDLSKIPVIVDGDPRGGFSADIWKACHDLRAEKKAGVLEYFTGLFRSTPKPASDFFSERSGLVRNYSEITVKPYHDSPEEILLAVKKLAEMGVELSRVKGALSNGRSIDVVKEGPSYSLKNAGLVEEGGYLSLRSFSTQLRRHVGVLTAFIGTPEGGSEFLKQILAGYPDELNVRRMVGSGSVPMGFESDRLLNDLRDVLPHVQYVSDDGRIEELGEALVASLKASIETRLSLITSLNESPKSSVVKNYGLLNAYYFLLDVVTDPNIRPYFQHPDLELLYDRMRLIHFEKNFFPLVVDVPELRFEGRKNLSKGELSKFARVARRASAQELVSQDSVNQVFLDLEGSKDMDMQAYSSALREGV